MIMKPSLQLVKATLRKAGAALGSLRKSLDFPKEPNQDHSKNTPRPAARRKP